MSVRKFWRLYTIITSVLIVALIAGSLTYYFMHDGKSSVHADFQFEPRRDTDITNSEVLAIAKKSNGNLLIGGSFSYVGPERRGGVWIDPTTQAEKNFPKFNDSVFSIISDGNGGWYVGGRFDKVGGQVRNRVVRIQSNGTIDPTFTPPAFAANSRVLDLLLNGSTLYVVGDFSQIDGVSQRGFGALNATTGARLAVASPLLDGFGIKLSLNSGFIYLGGSFMNVTGSLFRPSLVRLNASTHALDTTWAPNPNSAVQAIAHSADGNTLYIGGGFSSAGLQPRSNVAAVNSAAGSTGAATLWNPGGNGSVQDLIRVGSTLYASGTFTSLGGSTRNFIAALDTTVNTNNALPWNPNITNPGFVGNDGVAKMFIHGSTMYVTGKFYAVGGTTKYHLASLDLSTGVLGSLNYSIDKTGKTLWVDNSNMFIGGEFQITNGKVRGGLAEIDGITGKVTNWSADTDGTVYSIIISGTTAYVGGSFSTLANTGRSNLGAVHVDTGVLQSWNPGADDSVYTMKQFVNDLYVGGEFTTIGGASRNRIARLSLLSNTASNWDPNATGGPVRTIHYDPGSTKVYAGGDFNNIGGQPRSYLAELDSSANTNNASGWNPNPDGIVNVISSNGSNIYVGGQFTNISGTTRNFLAAYDASGAITLRSWDANIGIDGHEVNTINVHASMVFVGGEFYSANAQTRNYLFAAADSNAAIDSWNPDPDWRPSFITSDSNKLYLGGDFALFPSTNDSFYQRGFVILSTKPIIQFSTNSVTNAESVGSYGVTVQMDRASEFDVSVDYSVTVNSGTLGTDYIVSNGTLTIPSGDTSGIITITVSDDQIDESNESFNLTLSNPVYADLGAQTGIGNIITDNDTAGYTIVQSGGTTEVNEGGGTDSFTVQLDTQPEFDVTVNIGTGGSDITLNTPSLVFTSSNWNTPQTVTVTPIDDSYIESLTEVVGVGLSGLGAFGYTGLMQSINVNVYDNDTAGVSVIHTSGSTNVSEPAASDTYQISLTAEPISDVDITLSASSSQISVLPETIIFTSVNWNTPQTVTVSAVDDLLAEGNHISSVEYNLVSSDADFHGLSVAPTIITITDNDVPAVIVDETGGSTSVAESGAGDSFTLKLSIPPLSDVSISVNAGLQLQTTPSTITFTSGNWNIPQTINVNAVNDNIAEGSTTSTLQYTASSADVNYDDLAITGTTVSITDNDYAGISLVQSDNETSVTEASLGDSITIVLLSQPTSNVSIAASGNKGLTITPPTVTLTAGNWNTPQTMTITKPENTTYEGSQSATVTFSVNSSDANYDDFAIPALSVSLFDNDPQPTPSPTTAPTQAPAAISKTPTPTVSASPTPSAEATATPEPTSEPTATPSLQPSATTAPTVKPTAVITNKVTVGTGEYSLQVKVVDEKTLPVAGATVELKEAKVQARTAGDGLAEFQKIAKGSYTILVGYENKKLEEKLVLDETTATPTSGSPRLYNLTITLGEKERSGFNLFEQLGYLGTGVLALSTLLTLFYVLPLFKYLLVGGFLLPFLVSFFSMGRKGGKVINDMSNDGVIFAGVKIFDATGKLVMKKVTGLGASFYLPKMLGAYTFDVSHPKYQPFQAETFLQKTAAAEVLLRATPSESETAAFRMTIGTVGIKPQVLIAAGMAVLSLVNLMFVLSIPAIVLCGFTAVMALFIYKYEPKKKQLS